MNQLKEEGYEIEAGQNKGYRLNGTPDVLSLAELQSRVKTRMAGKELLYFDVIDSTNLEAILSCKSRKFVKTSNIQVMN